MSMPQPLTLINTCLSTGGNAFTSLFATTSQLDQKTRSRLKTNMSNMEEAQTEVSSASYGLCSLVSAVIELFETTLLFNN